MKKVLVIIAQTLVTVGIFVWIFHDPEKRRQMAEAIQGADKGWLAIGVLFYFGCMFAGAVRWYVLLKAQGIRLSFWRSFALFMIGAFFNLFLPGATGGDLIKIFYIIREAPDRKATAFFSVVIDRIIGLLGLMVLALVMILWRYDYLTQTPTAAGFLWVLIGILAAALSGILLSFVIAGFNVAGKLPQKFPLRDKFIELSAAYHLYGKAWPSLLLALALSLVVHLCFVSMFWAANRSINAAVPAADMIAIGPIVATMQALPASLSGTGVREAIWGRLLHDLAGLPVAIGNLIGLVGTVLIYLFGVLGGPIYIFYRRSAEADGHTIRAEEINTGCSRSEL